MNQKGSANLALVGIIVVLAGVIVYLLLAQKSAPVAVVPTPTPIPTLTSTPTPTPTPLDEIAGWETYKNDKYGFELKFPSSWSGYSAKERTLSWGSNDKSDSIDFGLAAQESLFNINIHSKDQWSKINSEQGSKPTYINENDKFVFAYSLPQYSANQEMADRIDEIKSIISTFRFTEKDATADWKVIRDEKAGYEFSYPKNLDLGRGLPPRVITSSKDLSDTLAQSEGVLSKGKVTINGIQYTLSVGSGAAAGSTYEDYFYKTVYNGKTFTIYFPVRLATDCKTYASKSDQAKCEMFEAEYKKQIEDIVKTFKFID